MKLRRAVRWTAGGMTVVVVVGAAAIATLTVHRRQLQDRAARLEVATEQSQRLRQAYTDQETAQRGFVIGGSPELLAQYENSGAAVAGTLAALRSSTGSTPEAGRLVAAVETAGRQWQDQAGAPAVAARQAGQPERAATVVNSTPSLFTAVRDRLDDLDRTLVASASRAADDELAAQRWLVVLLLTVLAIFVVALTVMARLVRRALVRPLAAIADSATLVAEGDIDHPLPIGGPDEVASIGRAVEDMRLQLRSRILEAEVAREAISQQAALVVGLQAELAGELGQFPPGWTGAAGLVPAEGYVAGDCYDVFLLSPTQIGLVVLDIAGHGAAAAIAALKNKEILHAALLSRTSPGDALALLAEDYAGRDDFVSVFVAHIDTTTGALTYANGGHPAAVLHSAHRLLRLAPTGPILSVLGGAWTTRQGAIEPGEKLFAYTDGVVEARTTDRSLYGTDRLERLLVASVAEDAGATVQRCLDDVASFSGGRQADDATAVCLRRSGSSG